MVRSSERRLPWAGTVEAPGVASTPASGASRSVPESRGRDGPDAPAVVSCQYSLIPNCGLLIAWPLLELDKDLALLDAVADAGVHLGDGAGDGGGDDGLHLHRLQDDEDVVDLDRLANDVLIVLEAMKMETV